MSNKPYYVVCGQAKDGPFTAAEAFERFRSLFTAWRDVAVVPPWREAPKTLSVLGER